jgi:hypothetical protein
VTNRGISRKRSTGSDSTKSGSSSTMPSDKSSLSRLWL